MYCFGTMDKIWKQLSPNTKTMPPKGGVNVMNGSNGFVNNIFHNNNIVCAPHPKNSMFAQHLI